MRELRELGPCTFHAGDPDPPPASALGPDAHLAWDLTLATDKPIAAIRDAFIFVEDLATIRIERADVVLANLTGAVLVRYAAELRSLVADGGYLILSGFAPQDVAVIQMAFSGLTSIDVQTDGEWAAVALRS